MDDDGQAGAARRRLARGTAPKTVAVAQQASRSVGAAASSVGAIVDEPARSIAEAVERLMSDREADEAISEWARPER
jgi:hypothetical protein